jgi:hypothetical protein
MYAPRQTGALGAHTAVRVGNGRVSITWTEPQAKVQEFATRYTRVRSGVEQTVNMVNVSGPPPRFAYKARDELAPRMGEDLLDAVARACASGGYFVVTGSA